MPPPQLPAPPTRVIRALVNRLTTKLSDLDAGAVRIVKSAAPPKHRERIDYSTFIVFGTRAERVIAALEARGYTVERVTPSTSSVRSASSS